MTWPASELERTDTGNERSGIGSFCSISGSGGSLIA